MHGEYSPSQIESKWQAHWEAHSTFKTPNPGEVGFDPDKPKFYVLDMFPYPSGAGLHVGHPEGYTATDIVARYRRMCGYNVLHPMGWDAFGLPAEQHAVETGQHPAVTTKKNIDTFRRQLKMLGFSYDWDREVATTDPEYYRWTQWIFLQLFNSWFDDAAQKARPIGELDVPAEVQAEGDAAVRRFVDSQRLAYLAEVPVNWCPVLGTVLSNEEVTNDGRSDRGNHPVFRRPMRQWMLRITKYADRLVNDLEALDWPESVKLMQRNWVGRSEGAQVRFKIDGFDEDIEVFTTRPDTLFGATYMVLAPEHPLVEQITSSAQRDAVTDYCTHASRRSELDRTADAKEKTGVDTGALAINPANNEKIPIWVADYVLMTYGTGAIMAVPAGDLRDWEFAWRFHLPVRPVVQPPEGYKPSKEESARAIEDGGKTRYPYVGSGRAINSGAFDGLSTEQFKKQIITWLEERGLGRAMVNYKLRDWLFSRQRYWGEPFPILHGPDGEIVALDESELPLLLPEVDDYRPVSQTEESDALPEPPLGRATSWVEVQRDGKTYRRELNTMPQWAGSCWYYLRFLDPSNNERLCSEQAEQYWMVSKKKDGTVHAGGIDLYLGGAEHAVLHLLYARFWHKVLFDLSHVSTPEPFGKLFNQGMIRSFAYKDSRGAYVSPENVERKETPVAGQATATITLFLKRPDGSDEPVTKTVEKMSKSLKNVINPDEVVSEYGADSLRLYEMFMGPLDASKPWNPRDVPGVFRFLQRVWRLIAGEGEGLSSMVVDSETTASRAGPGADLEKALHATIKKVGVDIDRMAFNTAISAMMSFVNEAYRVGEIHRDQAQRFVLLLAPFAPHISEELWQRLAGKAWDGSLAYEPWPTHDDGLLVEEEIEIPVQVNGKLAGRITVAKDADEQAVRASAQADAKVAARIGEATVIKTIYVLGRMLNLILKN